MSNTTDAYLISNMDEISTVEFCSRLDELMTPTAPQVYHKYVVTINGKTVLYARLRKSLSSCLKSAVFYYK